MNPLKRIKISLMTIGLTLDRAIMQRTVDADKWDESKHPRKQNGQFGKGGNGGKKPLLLKSKSDIITAINDPRTFNLQLFAVEYEKYTEKGLKKSIRHNQTRIRQHEEKIKNPSKFVDNWEERNNNYQKGLISHWKKEIKNLHNQIRYARNELNRRNK